MSDIVIRVEGLSKQYRLGQIGGTTLREDVSRWWARLRHQPDPTLKVTDANVRDRRAKGVSEPPDVAVNVGGALRRGDSGPPTPDHRPPTSVSRGSAAGDYVWALKDVSFEVKRGEVLGIIGRNGAGKSTLLKILSRITAPTTGQVKVKGRIASLLEIGTGMHPELTGRENIYLNGAILGMTKAEIQGKLDEIVAFSGVERYIDTPVKRYSSGMMVRLGFAVAAHLEPEILIVDEVLAVGDAEFQKKCLGKMSEVAHGGRTVLFVSHNMASVGALTGKCLVLSDGQVSLSGDTADAIAFYTESMETALAAPAAPGFGSLRYEERYTADPRVRFASVRAVAGDGRGIAVGGDLSVAVTCEAAQPLSGLRLGYTVRHGSGGPVLNGYSPTVDLPAAGCYALDLVLRRTCLAPGKYDLCLSLNTGGLTDPRYYYDTLVGVAPFRVSDRTLGGGSLGHWSEAWGRVVHSESRITARALPQDQAEPPLA